MRSGVTMTYYQPASSARVNSAEDKAHSSRSRAGGKSVSYPENELLDEQGQILIKFWGSVDIAPIVTSTPVCVSHTVNKWRKGDWNWNLTLTFLRIKDQNGSLRCLGITVKVLHR